MVYGRYNELVFMVPYKWLDSMVYGIDIYIHITIVPYKWLNTMVYGRYNYNSSFHGGYFMVYKPTNSHHVTGRPIL